MQFGEKLKRIRTSNGLSQEQLAGRIGVSRQAITKWETNRGLPDFNNIISMAELFNVTIDELMMPRECERKAEDGIEESETIYDIDGGKHFDIHVGSVRTLSVGSCDDSKVHIKLKSDVLHDISSIYKVKIDEKKKRLDIDCQNKQAVSKFQAEQSLDIVILLPKDLTEHCEIAANAKTLYIENIKLNRLEYDGGAEHVYIKNTETSIELTGKTDYEIEISGSCTKLDVNQWFAKSLIHIKDINQYTIVNKGRKSKIYFIKDGIISEELIEAKGENIISTSGIRSELMISVRT